MQLFSSQLYEINIAYLLMIAEVTPKQCLGTILMSKRFSINKLRVCEMRVQQFLSSEL